MEAEICALAPSDWQIRSVEDVCKRVTSGGTPSRARPEFYVDGSWPWVKTQELQDTWIDYTEEKITDEAVANSSAKVLPPNTILLAMYGATVGQLGILRSPMTCNQACCAMIVDPDKADFRYLFHHLRYSRTQLKSLATGAAQQNLSGALIKSLLYPFPPLDEQKAIAAVLGALDDKIELNRRMNATLEAMARALFQSWFVDFDPVRAKLDGRPPAALDPATAALFPASFHDSAVGHIPSGWKVGVLDELTKFVIGGDWGATEATENETVSCYCIRGADIPSLQSGGVGKMPTRFLKPSSVEKRHLADGDLAIEISGGSPTQCTGRPVLASEALLESLGRPLVASNFCRIVKLKSRALSKFVYLWLRRLYDAGELFQFETGTTGIKNFAFAIFSETYPLVVPDLRVADAFDRAVSPFFARIQANSHESRTLATLRDTLLPKLLSGEVRVTDTKDAYVRC